MFRDDRCTIARPNKTKVNGEVVYATPTLIAENVPCHLSVKALSPVNQTQSTATVLLDYVLFIDRKQGITINKNDIIEVTRPYGEIIALRAGESHKYPYTIQTHCEVNKVA
jgi:hypothetical protein